MMEKSDKYCVYSPGFQGHIGIALKELHSKKDFCDVTLACKDKRIHAHRFIIASSSPVLKNFLKQNLNRHPVIPLEDVKAKDLENLLKFMYEGEVNIDTDDIDSFFEIAERLKVRGLIKENKNEPKSNEDTSNEMISTSPELALDDNLLSDKMKTNSFHQITEANHYKHIYDGDFLGSENFYGQSIGGENVYGQSFQQERQLVNYERSDEKSKDKRRFACPKCSKRFTTKYVLSRHIEAIHEGVVYSCDQCEKQFGQAANLWKHKTFVHEGKRYTCDQCPYKSTQKGYLRTHMKKHHNIEMTEYGQVAKYVNGLDSSFDRPIRPTSSNIEYDHFIENSIKTEVVENENELNSEYDATNYLQLEDSQLRDEDSVAKTENGLNSEYEAPNSFQITELIENENGLNSEYEAPNSFQITELMENENGLNSEYDPRNYLQIEDSRLINEDSA